MGMLAGGAITAAIGSIRKGKQDSRRKEQLNQLSELPGVDVSQATADALAGRKANFQDAAGIARQQNEFDQQEMERLLESSIPGYKSMQASRAANAQSFLNGDLPPAVRSQIYRRGAAKAIGGGYGGSEAHDNLVARDLGLSSLDLMDRGQRYTSSIIGSTPMARLSSTRELSGVDPNDVLGLRSKERTEKIGLKRAFISQPGVNDAWADFDMQLGGAMMGGGMTGMGRMGGGGGSSIPSASKMSSMGWSTPQGASGMYA